MIKLFFMTLYLISSFEKKINLIIAPGLICFPTPRSFKTNFGSNVEFQQVVSLTQLINHGLGLTMVTFEDKFQPSKLLHFQPSKINHKASRLSSSSSRLSPFLLHLLHLHSITLPLAAAATFSHQLGLLPASSTTTAPPTATPLNHHQHQTQYLLHIFLYSSLSEVIFKSNFV